MLELSDICRCCCWLLVVPVINLFKLIQMSWCLRIWRLKLWRFKTSFIFDVNGFNRRNFSLSFLCILGILSLWAHKVLSPGTDPLRCTSWRKLLLEARSFIWIGLSANLLTLSLILPINELIVSLMITHFIFARTHHLHWQRHILGLGFSLCLSYLRCILAVSQVLIIGLLLLSYVMRRRTSGIITIVYLLNFLNIWLYCFEIFTSKLFILV